jgi:hypothetical protein
MIGVEHLARSGQAGRLARCGGLGQGGHPVRQRGFSGWVRAPLGTSSSCSMVRTGSQTYWMMIGLPL